MADSMSPKQQDFLCQCYKPFAMRYQLLSPVIGHKPQAICSSFSGRGERPVGLRR